MRWLALAGVLAAGQVWAQDASVPAGANCETLRTCACVDGYSDYLECPTQAMCAAACQSQGGLLFAASGQTEVQAVGLPGTPAQASLPLAPPASAVAPIPSQPAY